MPEIERGGSGLPVHPLLPPAASEGQEGGFPAEEADVGEPGAVRMGGSETPWPGGPFSAVLGTRAGLPLIHMHLIVGPTQK